MSCFDGSWQNIRRGFGNSARRCHRHMNNHIHECVCNNGVDMCRTISQDEQISFLENKISEMQQRLEEVKLSK